jgi:hypothetical protein
MPSYWAKQAAADLDAYWAGTRSTAKRRRRAKRINNSAEPWSAGEQLRLRELASTVQVRQVARMLSNEFGVPRTKAAVSVRAHLLGISLWWDGYSQNQVAELFGVWFKTVERWRCDGLLEAHAWEVGRGRFGQWHFTEQDLASFIDTCQWAYGLEKMPAGPFRSRAEVAHHADPWLTSEEVAHVWNVSRETVCLWVRQGRIPHKRRQAGMGLPKIMIRAPDLPGLRAELREQALANLRAGIQVRDARRRRAAA